MKILIVDDDPFTAIDLAEEFDLAGNEVLGPINNRPEALALARSRHPEVVLLEVHLGNDGSGLDLAMDLGLLNIPVLFMSAYSSIARENADLALGYLAKPYDPLDIPAVIETLVAILAGRIPAPRSIPRILELFSANVPPLAPPARALLHGR